MAQDEYDDIPGELPERVELKAAPDWAGIVSNPQAPYPREIYCPTELEFRKEEALSYLKRRAAIEYLKNHAKTHWSRHVWASMIQALDEQMTRFMAREEIQGWALQQSEHMRQVIGRIVQAGMFGEGGEGGPTIH